MKGTLISSQRIDPLKYKKDRLVLPQGGDTSSWNSPSSAKPLDRAMLSHRLGRHWQLSTVCMALHDAYKGSPYFHRVGQSAGVILPYRNDHNIAKDFVALCKLVLNNLCPLSCYQNHVDRLGRVRNL